MMAIMMVMRIMMIMMMMTLTMMMMMMMIRTGHRVHAKTPNRRSTRHGMRILDRDCPAAAV